MLKLYNFKVMALAKIAWCIVPVLYDTQLRSRKKWIFETKNDNVND